MTQPIGTVEISSLIVAAILGAILAAGLRWLESSPGSNERKPKQIIYSLIKGSIAGIAFIFRYQESTNLVIWDYITVFISSAGFDSLIKTGTTTVRQTLSI